MQLADAGLAANTRRAYGTGARSYFVFVQLKLPGTIALPAVLHTACAWIAYLHQRGLKFTTIKAYISGLASAHRDAGLDTKSWLQSPLFSLTFRGIKRVQGTASTVQRKLPITFALLRRITPLLNPHDHDALTVRAAMWCGTAGLLRTGEFTVDSGSKPDAHQLLTIASARQIQTAPPVWSIHLRASKTDPFRLEADVPIANRTAVTYLATYLRHRNATGTDEPHRPLFMTANGQPLTRTLLLSTVRQLLTIARIITSPTAGVSFRRGGATALANANVADRLIKLAGRWRSPVYERYIDTNLPTLVAHTANL